MRYAIIHDGAPVEIFPNQGFGVWLLVETPPAEEGGEPGSELQSFTVPSNWLDFFKPAEFEQFGVHLVAPTAPPEGQRVALADLVVDGAVVVEVATFEDIPPPVLVVPMAVDMRQARIKLLREGVLDVVDGMIEAAGEPEVAIEWRFAKEVRRDHPFINGVQLLLGKTTPEMDLWFVQASQIGPMGAE